MDPGFIQTRKEEYIGILKELIRQKTVNPPGDEYLAAAIVQKRLSQLHVPFTTHEKEKGRTNTIARIGTKTDSNKAVLFSAHLDVVPAGEGWDTDPFEPTIKPEQPNIMYGRGTIDNKGQATAILLIAEYLKSIEPQLKNQFIFVWAADEEHGSKQGIKYLFEQKLLDADLAIVPDVSGALELIDVAEKGVLDMVVTSHGKQAHGSRPQLGINAIGNMSRFICAIEKHVLAHSPHRFLSAPTMNVGTISGGSAANTVPARCEMVINIRTLPGMTSEAIVEELSSLSQGLGKFDFDVKYHIPPTEVDPDNVLVKTIQEVGKRHGLDVKLHGLTGATDTKTFNLNGIPAIGYDFADIDLAHNANEYVNLDNLFRYVELMSEVCLELDRKI